MKLIFMGTPNFSVTILDSLIKNNFDIVAVYTQPDRKKGRGHKVMSSPVKNYALEHDIPVYQPVSFSDHNVISQLKSHNADAAVVAAYGRILPIEALSTVKTFINVHASLLPKYRGAAPIQWAIRNGDDVTGISIMKMEAGMDTGPVYIKAPFFIRENETTGSLFEELASLGADVLTTNLPAILNGDLLPEPQNDSNATYAPMFNRSDESIDWTSSAKSIERLNRAYGPTPGTYTFLDNKRLKFMHIFHVPDKESYETAVPGEIVKIERGVFYVKTGDGLIGVDKIQPPGKKTMTVLSFLNGQSLTEGMIFKSAEQ